MSEDKSQSNLKRTLSSTPGVDELLHSHTTPPSNLPIVEEIEAGANPEKIETNIQPLETKKPKAPTGYHTDATAEIITTKTSVLPNWKKYLLWSLKNVVPYIIIFVIGIVIYFFYFSDFTFNNYFKSSSDITLENIDTSNKDLEKLKADEAKDYERWVEQFFFKVNDQSITAMDADVSGNGLTNFEKFLLNLNPKVYSTRGIGKPDGQLVAEDINPWTGLPFSDAQKELVNKYINKELISNRITAAALNRGVTKFAQYVQTDSPYYVAPELQGQTEANTENVVNGNTSQVNPEVTNNQVAYQTAQQSGGSANLNPSSDIDQSKPGKLEIPANNISVPLIWTQEVANFDSDLKKGVVHYPGTVLPGQIGTSYISGHSSGYVWDRSPYKQIFATLGQVKDGTSFVITVTQKDGKQVKYHYVVAGRGEYLANDQEQFVNTAESVVALSTCWPVNTTARRLVLFGKLTQTERP